MMDDDQRKHLDYLQGVINRLAGNAFAVKGWSLTVVALVLSYAATTDSWPVAGIGVGVSLVFSYLDAYFVRQERMFRHLYSAVVTGAPVVQRYSMDTALVASQANTRWPAVVKSPPLLVMFGAQVVAGLVVAFMTASA